MKELLVTVYGITFIVKGYFDLGDSGDYFEPPTPPEFDIEHIYIEDSKIDILEVLAEEVREKIEDEIFEQLKNE